MMNDTGKSRSQLVDELWDAAMPAWIFGSLGTISFFGSIFWRFVVFPPSLVIRYQDGLEVWGFRGHTYRGDMPEMPFWTDYIFVTFLISGALVFYFGTLKWRRISRELRIRNQQDY